MDLLITPGALEWELQQQGLDTNKAEIKAALDEVKKQAPEGLVQVQYETFLDSIREILQKEDGFDSLPEWRKLEDVMADCPEEVKNPPDKQTKMMEPLLAPPDVNASAPEEPEPQSGPDLTLDRQASINSEESEPTETSNEQNNINTPTPEEPRPNEEKEEPSSQWKRMLLVALVTCGAIMGIYFLWGHLYNEEPQPAANNKDIKSVHTQETSDKQAPPAPTTPPENHQTTVTAPAPVPQEQQPKPDNKDSTSRSDTIKLTCDITPYLVGTCNNVPDGCSVGRGIYPIKATCGSDVYCSRHSGPAAGSSKQGNQLILKKSWCNPS